MTTIQENIMSPYIQHLAQNIFGTQQQYIQDLLKIKKLMNKSKLGILSEQLFGILIQKYPQEYNLLLMEQSKELAPTADVEVTNKEGIQNNNLKTISEKIVLKKNSPHLKGEVSYRNDSTEGEKKDQNNYEYWIKLYGKP